jgi:hypothetical protein
MEWPTLRSCGIKATIAMVMAPRNANLPIGGLGSAIRGNGVPGFGGERGVTWMSFLIHCKYKTYLQSIFLTMRHSIFIMVAS